MAFCLGNSYLHIYTCDVTRAVLLRVFVVVFRFFYLLRLGFVVFGRSF